jgi:hypothetical protein
VSIFLILFHFSLSFHTVGSFFKLYVTVTCSSTELHICNLVKMKTKLLDINPYGNWGLRFFTAIKIFILEFRIVVWLVLTSIAGVGQLHLHGKWQSLTKKKKDRMRNTADYMLREELSGFNKHITCFESAFLSNYVIYQINTALKSTQYLCRLLYKVNFSKWPTWCTAASVV